MTRRSDTPRRSDVTETVDRSKRDMEEKSQEIEKVVSDVETVRQTLESLDLGGTAEGAEETEQALDSAEEVTVDVFDREDEQLDTKQNETEEYEGNLNERSDTSKSDLGKISDASTQIDTTETTNELVKAKDSAIRDIEFLEGQARRALDARNESERVQNEHQSRVRTERKK
jgi:P2-related tail formation protein